MKHIVGRTGGLNLGLYLADQVQAWKTGFQVNNNKKVNNNMIVSGKGSSDGMPL